LLVTHMLSPSELQWLNRYHARVRATLEPALDGEDRQWLLAATEPVEALSL